MISYAGNTSILRYSFRRTGCVPLEAVVWFDPVTQAYGLPGEDAEVLAKRLLPRARGRRQ